MSSLLRFRLRGVDQIKDSFEHRAKHVADLEKALKRSAILTRDAAVLRIKAGGMPRWVPSKRVELYGGVTGIVTSAMWRGIKCGPPQTSGGKGTIDVGTSGLSVKYATIFQRGSGSRGGRSDWTTHISARNAGALSWVSGGRRFFARSVTVTHHGQVPRPFLYFDDALRARIVAVFAKHLGEVVEG